MSGALVSRRALLVCVFGLAVLPAAQAGFLQPGKEDDGVLPVDDAMRPLPAVWKHGKLMLGIEAAPNCYVYRDKISIEAVDPVGYKLGPPRIPAGEAHRDEHFGEVKILRGATEISFAPAGATPPRQLRIRYQGCAENLVCYPPQTKLLDVEIVP